MVVITESSLELYDVLLGYLVLTLMDIFLYAVPSQVYESLSYELSLICTIISNWGIICLIIKIGAFYTESYLQHN